MINSSQLTQQYQCDGVQEEYDIVLEYLRDQDNIKITYFDQTNKLEYDLVNGTNYTIDDDTGKFTTMTGAIGTLGTVTSPFGSDVLLTVSLNVPYTQKTDITSNSNYDPEVLERAYDHGVLLAKQNRERSGRALTLSITDSGTDLELLPIEQMNGGVIGIEDGEVVARYGFIPKTWDSNYEYSAGNITQYSGDMWICLQTDTGTEPSTDESVWEKYVGRKAEWDAKINYSADDTVFYNGLIYVASSDNLNKEPGVETSYWTEMNVYGTRWNSNVDYLEDDITSYNGVLIKAVQDNKGQTPDINPGGDTTYWEVVETGGAVKVNGVVGTDSISQFDLVYFDNGTDDGDNPADAGKLVVADKRYLDKAIISGFATTGGTSGDTIQVQSKGKLTGFPASSFTAGNKYYLGNNGAFCTKGDIDWQEYIVFVGVAIDDTTLDVNIQMPEPTTKQDDGTPIGGIRYFSTYKDRSAYGYLSFDFDNAISIANYPKLFEEIGHIYNDQHVAAGDADLSGSSTLFYPTPVPGAYDRVAIPDSEDIDSSTADTTTDRIVIALNDFDRFKRMKYWNTSADGDGVPVYLKVTSGSLPSGLSEDTLYYIHFYDSDNSIYFCTSEEDAITGDNIVDITATATGTFRLTQEGINLDDAFQGHWHQVEDTGGNHYSAHAIDNGSSYTGMYISGAGDVNAKTISNDSTNGTPRTTNETRPKTNFLYGYIKAEYITTAGEPISALRYDTGWIANSDWTDMDVDITHGLNTSITNLSISVFVASSASDDSAYLLSTVDTSTGGVYARGIGLQNIDDNTISLYSESEGVEFINVSGFQVLTTQSYYYKVVVTKPNLVSTVFDVSSLPKTYDLTSENVTVTLPEITGAMQTKSIYWTNGGTYKLTLAVTDGATVGGEAAGTWEGEGEGHILLESDGSNWQVREYEDYIEYSNTNDDQYIWKYKDGTERQIILSEITTAINTTAGNIYRSTLQSVITRNHSFNTFIKEETYINYSNNNSVCWTSKLKDANGRGTTTATAGYYLVDVDSIADADYIISQESIGTWK